MFIPPTTTTHTHTPLSLALRVSDPETFALQRCEKKIKVMYDASGVRQHAGKQANVLNQIISELPPEHPVSDVRPLKDTLGHTPTQVFAGACTGVIVGSLYMANY